MRGLPQHIELTDIEAEGHIGWVRVNGVLDLQICRYKDATRIFAFSTKNLKDQLQPLAELEIPDKEPRDDSAV